MQFCDVQLLKITHAAEIAQQKLAGKVLPVANEQTLAELAQSERWCCCPDLQSTISMLTSNHPFPEPTLGAKQQQGRVSVWQDDIQHDSDAADQYK